MDPIIKALRWIFVDAWVNNPSQASRQRRTGSRYLSRGQLADRQNEIDRALGIHVPGDVEIVDESELRQGP